MNDKTEQALTDALRLAAKSAAPYGTAMIGASHLREAADTIDTLRAQLAELSTENERLREQRNRIGLCIDRALNGGKKDDHEAGLGGRMDAIRALVAEARRDEERLDWLGNQFVTVRVPLRYCSKECFMGSPTDNDGEFIPWNIRAEIDAAKGGSNA